MGYNRDKNYMRKNLNTKMKMRQTKRNLRNMAMITCLIVSILFVGCNKDDDDIGSNTSVIEAKNIEGVSSKVTTVVVYAGSNELFGTGDFKNGGFKIKLPKTPSDKSLESVKGSNASDQNAKTTDLYYREIYGLDANGDCVGVFSLSSDDYDNYYYVNYVYADRKFTLKEGDYYDCSFKKGWNIVYISSSSSIVTTTKPSGVTFKWHWYED